MALPMLTSPTYTMVIPSTDTTVKYRPFLVKEEKALMIAQQSEDPAVMVETLKNVVKDCVLDKIDTSKLATFDLEYMFMQIRGKSVGETIDLILSCEEDHGEQNEKAKVPYTININEIQVIKNPEHTNKITLYGDVGVVMRYPTVQDLKKLQNLDDNDLDKIFDVVAVAIDYIYDGDQIYYAKDQKHEELLQFLGNLSSQQFIQIQKFFETMPKLTKQVEYDCPVCGKHHSKTLEGIQSFF
jgi:Ni,Fe-hydrogenase III small subunit